MHKRVYFIINPAAGKPSPILYTLNQQLSTCGIKWEMGVTNKENIDKLLRQADEFRADLLGIYGGDGTIAEVAHKNLDRPRSLPMAILPGGTANILSLELGIPQEVTEAARLITEGDAQLRSVDIARINDRHFLTRAGFGLESKMVEGASQAMKNQMGNLAYTISAVRAVIDSDLINFSLSLDGHQIRTKGVACVIANCGNIGVPGVTLSPVEIDDGELDVFIFREKNFSTFFAAVRNIVSANDIEVENTDVLQHWRSRHISIDTDPVTKAQFDGQLLDESTIKVDLLEHKARILVPATRGDQR